MKPSKTNLILIGFMGTGKTAVAKALSQKLKKRMIELDHLIEKHEKMTIAQIFQQKGEPAFRRIERKQMKKALAQKNCVMATGGGIILNPLNVKDLRKNGTLICLTSSLKEITKRTAKNKKRPLLHGKNPFQKLRKLLNYRRPLYRQAGDIFVSSTGKTARQTAKEIINKLGK